MVIQTIDLLGPDTERWTQRPREATQMAEITIDDAGPVAGDKVATGLHEGIDPPGKPSRTMYGGAITSL